MVKQSHHPRWILAVILFLVASGVTGCSLFRNPERLRQQQKEVEEKKQRYTALYRFVSSAASPQDLTAPQIRELYGDPDDIFRSGSAGSRLEIWTYEKISTPQDEAFWDNIRLYFNNGQLMSWKF